jgi:hypothetical protein
MRHTHTRAGSFLCSVGLSDHMTGPASFQTYVFYMSYRSHSYLFSSFCCASDSTVKVLSSRFKTDVSYIRLRLVLGKFSLTYIFDTHLLIISTMTLVLYYFRCTGAAFLDGEGQAFSLDLA